MASIIKIYETQSVIYTDTTSGGLEPYNRTWDFSGGDISSATGPTAQVSYNNPGTYTASLTVTDFNNVTATNTISNGIEVLSASVDAQYSLSPSSILMGQSMSVNNTSTGLPENPTSYQWKIGGVNYATTTNITVSYEDWKVVPGANIAALPGDIVSVSIGLEATSSYSSDIENKSFNASKIGISETDLINKKGSGSPYEREISISNTTQKSGAFGYPTNSYIYRLDYSGAAIQSIEGFHSTLERATLTVTGLSGNSLFLTGGVAPIKGYIIVEAALYGTIYGTVDPEIATGKYIYPNLASGAPIDIFFADDGTTGNLTYLIDNSNYTQAIVDDILNNIYPQINSTQSDYYGAVFPITSLSGGFNPVVYSPTYFNNLGRPGVVYSVTLEINGTTVSCQFDDSSTGNEPSGNGEFYVMQDFAGIKGVASQLNDAIAATAPGGTASVEFTAVSNYNINSNGTPSDYYGLKMEVKDEGIEEVTIDDNSSTLNSLYGLSLRPFAYKYTGSTTTSCSGIPPTLQLGLLEYFTNGKNIQYGGSIF
jgi:hypothetical protein